MWLRQIAAPSAIALLFHGPKKTLGARRDSLRHGDISQPFPTGAFLIPAPVQAAVRLQANYGHLCSLASDEAERMSEELSAGR